MTTPSSRVQAKLELSSKNSLEIVSVLRGLGNGVPTNANLTPADLAKLPVTPAVMLANATALESTHNDRVSAPSKTATALEQTQRNTASGNITDTANYLEGVANEKGGGNAAAAAAILATFGLQTRSTPARHASVFETPPAPKGTLHVHIPAPPGGQTHANMIQYSLNGATSWSYPVVFMGADLIVTGIKSGSIMLVQMARVLSKGRGVKATVAYGSEQPAWSDSVSYTVA